MAKVDPTFTKTIKARGFEVARELIRASRQLKLAEEAHEESRQIAKKAKFRLVEKDDELRALEHLAGDVPFICRENDTVLTAGERAELAALQPSERTSTRMLEMIKSRSCVNHTLAFDLFTQGWLVMKDRPGMFNDHPLIGNRRTTWYENMLERGRYERASLVLVRGDGRALFVDDSIESYDSPMHNQRLRTSATILERMRQELGDDDFRMAVARALHVEPIGRPVVEECNGEAPAPEKAVAVGPTIALVEDGRVVDRIPGLAHVP